MISLYLRSIAALASDALTAAGDAVHHAGALAAIPFDRAAWALAEVSRR